MTPALHATTYARAGVDIAAGDRLVHRIAQLARSTRRPEVVAGVGGFAALARLPAGYRRPLLVTATDGVGTKLRIAFALGRHDTVGIDLVAMCVNDLLTIGAEPFLFLDYLATAKLDVRQGAALVRGIARGCRMAGCSLVGGETAEMPSFYAPGEYDLAGFAVGVVETGSVLDGSGTRPGDHRGRRSAYHSGRPLPAQDQTRRTPPTAERATGRHESGRSQAGGAPLR